MGNKAAKLQEEAQDYSVANPVAAEHIWNQLSHNYPAHSIKWVRHAPWVGPVNVPQSDIDYDDEKKWAASHQPSAVSQFAKDIKNKSFHLHPVVMVKIPGKDRFTVIDGHHRTLAYRKLDRPVVAYVGKIKPADVKEALQSHSYQIHQGASPANKSESDPAAGKWEFAGGQIEFGESPVQAAIREWQEETGMSLPTSGQLTGEWKSPNGVYAGFVYTIPSEDDLPILDGRDQAWNPDDPDGDRTESVAWWSPDDLKNNPAVRTEIIADLENILAALDG